MKKRVPYPFPEQWHYKKSHSDKTYLILSLFFVILSPLIPLITDHSLFQREQFLLKYLILTFIYLGISTTIIIRLSRRSYGFNQSGIFKQGLFRRVFLPWDSLISISNSQHNPYPFWSGSDLITRKGLSIYTIKGQAKTLKIPQSNEDAHYFAGAVEHFSGLKIKNKPAEIFEIIQLAIEK